MEKLSSKQAGIITFLSVISLKAVVFPAVLYFYAGTSGYVTVLMAMLFDFLILLSYLWVMKQNPDMTFFDIITNFIGKICAKIVFIIVFLYFIIKTFLLMKSTYNFFVQVVYDNLNWVYFLIATIFFIYFVLNKKIRTFGRCGEVVFWLIFISINFVLLISSFNMDLTRVLPFLPNGIGPVASTGLRCSFAFGDYMILILLMGNVKYTDNTNKKITMYALMGINTVFNLFIVFLCAFGYTATNQSLAIADLSLYIDFSSTVSRLEWIAVFSWTITLVIQMVMYAFSSKSTLNHIIAFKNPKTSSVFVVLILTIAYVIPGVPIQTLVQALLSYEFGIFATIVQVGIPILLLLACLKQKRRNKSYVRLSSQTN